MKETARSKWGTALFHILLLLGVLSMISSSFKFTERARLLPLMIGLPTAVLLLVSLVRELKPDLVLRVQNWMAIFHSEETEDRNPAEFSSAVEQELPPLRSFFIGGAWSSLLFVLVLFLGFLAATVLLVPCFLFVFARYAWWRVLLYTAVLFLVEWYGFELLLGLKLWHGSVPEIIPGFVGGGILPPLF
jgi:Tripartite tricarboxylate transporter TctB family